MNGENKKASLPLFRRKFLEKLGVLDTLIWQGRKAEATC